MKIPNMIILRTGLVGLSLLVGTGMAQDDLSQHYCSNENTGSDFTPENSIYMSNGKCFDYCKASYAFAIVQYKYCWCSNYIPASQQSTGDCNQKCPGFPGDLCGNANSGMYGYIPLSIAPLGTAGASSAPPTSSSPPQSTEPPTSQTPSSSLDPVSSAPIPSSSSYSSSSPTPTPRTTVEVITKSGSVVTQTVTQTPIVIGSGNPGASSPEHMSVQQHPLSIGAVAGIVVGSLIGLAALLLAAFLIWRRKKNQDSEQATGSTTPTRRPKRNISVLSKTGLLSSNRPQSMAENHNDDNFYGTGSSSVRHSMMFGAGATVEGVSPASPLGGSQDNISSRRHSKPMVYDQRLNPSALFANADANGSRVSIQDQHDYSRPLGVANPDYRASFDSR